MNKTPEIGRLRVLMAPDYRPDNPYQSLLADALAAQGVDVVFPRGYRRVFPLWRALREQHPGVDVLHLHWLSPYLKGKGLLTYFLYCLKLLADLSLVRLAGVRIIWTIHNRTSHEALFPRLEMWLRRRLGAAAWCCIVHTEAAKAIVEKELGIDRSKVRVILHGHYQDAYPAAIGKRAARAALDLPAKGLVYLYFGAIRPYKGLETLLRVWRENPDLWTAGLLVAGAPLDEDYGKRISNLAAQCPGVFAHLGRVADHRIPVYFSAADVVVLPFQRALSSGSLILAMSYNKPVIAPRFDIVVETLGGQASLLYDPEDKRGLLDALLTCSSQCHKPFAGFESNPCSRPEWRDLASLTKAAYSSGRNSVGHPSMQFSHEPDYRQSSTHR